MQLISAPDQGMYDAINRDFSHATGDVYAWINSDDIYFPGAFSAVQRSLEMYPQITWIKGITSYIDENSTIHSSGKCHLYVQEWIREVIYGPVLQFILQDSVFWRPNLWGLVKDEISVYFLAGDYFIWRQFAKKHQLFSLNVYVSCFRKVSGQKSEAINKYWDEALGRNSFNEQLAGKIRGYYKCRSLLPDCVIPAFHKLTFGEQKAHLVTTGSSSSPALIEGSFEKLDKILS